MKQPLYLSATKPKQYLISTGLVVAVSAVCYAFSDYFSYHVTALVLLLAVSVIATLCDILPVLLAAALSALVLNFFFIPPLYTFHVQTPEDLLMLLMFFIIAIVNAVFTFRIKREERKTRERAARREALKLYNTLFNSLSHELKTPIATIIGAADTLIENTSLSPDNKTDLLGEIQLSGQRLHRQVENLLNMSRLESGMLSLNRDWCDCNELLHGVVRSLPDTNTHTLIVEENDSLPLFKFDIGLIRQAVYNITHNALIYTPAGSIIRLGAVQEADNCVITVTDNGPGIPHEAIGCLFDKFYRLPDTKAGGTGLGLSIARGFVAAHGGTITVKNVDVGGARFIIIIPAEASYLNKLKNE